MFRSIVLEDELQPTLAESQAAGFPMGGEGLAVDLADTLVTVSSPPADLLADDAAVERFWRLHAGLIPEGSAFPSAAETRRVRAVVRGLLDAAQQGVPLDRDAIEALNAVAASASPSVAIELRDGRAERIERWRADDPAAPALAAVARSAIEILVAPGGATVRRCASPSCSMLFVTGDPRRRWCTPNICANRARAARYYKRRRGAQP
jgi:predicted RNA-binding Zn ribbon-like protein